MRAGDDKLLDSLLESCLQLVTPSKKQPAAIHVCGIGDANSAALTLTGHVARRISPFKKSELAQGFVRARKVLRGHVRGLEKTYWLNAIGAF
jgi:hypothetical protein